ncbi:MAG TPA: hypothetical protein VM822_23325, partial [Pseudolabrys sp.]|nr:hypothetical protein [Pseudolabrys sp.]
MAEVSVFFGIEIEFACGPLGGIFSRQSVASIFTNIWITNEFDGVFEIAHNAAPSEKAGTAAFARTAPIAIQSVVWRNARGCTPSAGGG